MEIVVGLHWVCGGATLGLWWGYAGAAMGYYTGAQAVVELHWGCGATIHWDYDGRGYPRAMVRLPGPDWDF